MHLWYWLRSRLTHQNNKVEVEDAGTHSCVEGHPPYSGIGLGRPTRCDDRRRSIRCESSNPRVQSERWHGDDEVHHFERGRVALSYLLPERCGRCQGRWERRERHLSRRRPEQEEVFRRRGQRWPLPL